MLSSHNVPRFSGNDLTTNECAQPPIDARDTGGCVSWPVALPLAAVRGEYSRAFQWLLWPTFPHKPYRRTGAAVQSNSPRDASLQSDPGCIPAALYHACSPRLRLTTAGLHARRQECCALSHFFPRSVGFGPTASCAGGAFTIAPSMLCQRHAMPSISSYSANPLRHRFPKTPWRFHSKKYLCTELAEPNSAFGNAFHWHPVRNTYMMPAKTFRASIGFLPPPGRRTYSRFFCRVGFGTSGATLFQNSSDTVHDLCAFMNHDYTTNHDILQDII